MKIVVLDGYTLNPGDISWDGIALMGNLTVYDRTPAELIVPRIGEAEIVYTCKTPITDETLQACPSIRFISILSTGYNVVDIAAARARGIPVSNVPGYSTASVAQLVFAHLLEVCFQVGLHSREVFEGKWSQKPDFCYWIGNLTELDGKTIGIIGYGSIGRAVAKIAVAFGMRVLTCSPNSRPEPGSGAEYTELDTLLSESDVITLHVPLFASTQGMINKESIAKMKDGAILINTARGPLIVEEDVAEALKTGKLRAFCADVVSAEPISTSNPLLSAPNTFITPHIAWVPLEPRQRLMAASEANLKAFLNGKPQNVVN